MDISYHSNIDCPHCYRAIALTSNSYFLIESNDNNPNRIPYEHRVQGERCLECGKLIVILITNYDEEVPNKKREIIFPRTSTAPLPHSDMPEDVKVDYIEARAVFDDSPRAAAALLRLALQRLMPHLGEKGKNINDDIASLVKKGLSVDIQQMLDTMRVIGNEAVHPGELNFNDNKEIATALFKLLNMIIERMISEPKKIQAIYESLPESKKKEIAERDKKPE